MAISTETFSKVPAFQGCSSSSLQLIFEKGTLLKFSIGQALSSGSLIPDRILFILSGKARLLGKDKGKLSTLATFGAYNFIGLSSLLRAEPCEECSAAEETIAWSIPDSIIAELYNGEESFRKWCDSTVFPAEIFKLSEALIKESQGKQIGIIDVAKKIIQEVKAYSADDKSIFINSKNNAFVGSANSDADLYSRIKTKDDIPGRKGTFNVRILSISESLVKSIGISTGDDEQKPNHNLLKQFNNKIKNTDTITLANRTSLDLKGDDPAKTLTLVRGEGTLQESIACIKMLAELLDLPFRQDSIEKSIRDSLQREKILGLPTIGQLLAGMGLLCTAAEVPSTYCTRLNAPSVIYWLNSFSVIIKSDANGLLLAHPRLGWLQVTPDEILEHSPENFQVLLVSRTSKSPNTNFNFSWFFPAIKQYRSSLMLVLASSFIVQLFSLANPLLIQVIIDKVISQRSLDTLQVLGFALVAITLFEGLLSSVRTFLFTETTNRIDMRLGAEVIDHLLRLPVSYFDKRPVGELGTRVAELEKIRNFLTGEALTTIIDAAFSIIYIIVMAIYSWLLTAIALIVVPIQVAVTLLGAPLFRRQFRQAAEENAKTQSHLIEVLTGIQTVKAQNVEIVSRWKWQERYSRYISRTFQKTITGTALNQTGQVLQKLSQLMVLWVGATLVLEGKLSLGQLIAFRIISGYVTQPLLRLSSIWQRIQELKVSFERLADIVDTTEESTEIDQSKIALPPISGKVSFENLYFRFSLNSPEVLKNINLDIPAGKFVGVVGQSGSGKSTLMKLIPRLYSPNEGRILIDDYDIDKVELYSLRRQIGIVPQEPLLFTGTVSENIALTDPNARSEEIVNAAKISCAHEFIMKLPDGYSTELGERATSLSGGQRQRIAIARTLLANPKMLVMDEATSALDYDTERRVCQNLREGLKNCTVFFVTHRLSTVRNADTIIMMHQGAIVETGSHEELMNLKGRYYALFRQQDSA